LGKVYQRKDGFARMKTTKCRDFSKKGQKRGVLSKRNVKNA
jgi:hypothetical protein